MHAMATTSFYKRRLPCPPAVEFASSAGKELFVEALGDGNMEGFFPLIACFQTQAEPAYCGLASLAVVLNALSIDPGRTWKGPWRWYDESMLDCCEPLDKIKVEGITFAKVACLAKCAGATVRCFRASESTEEEFRHYIKECVSSDDQHMIVSYHRGHLQQTGSGHFSPIGGYHAKTDMVFLLDVARFKYPPHWVPLPLLWEAMNAIDSATNQSRGFILVSKGRSLSSFHFTLSCKNGEWKAMALYLMERVVNILKSMEVKNLQKALSLVLSSLPTDVTLFINWIAEVKMIENMEFGSLSKDEVKQINEKSTLLEQLRATEIYKLIGSGTEDGSTASDSGESLPQTIFGPCCEGSSPLSSLRSEFNNLANGKGDHIVPATLLSSVGETPQEQSQNCCSKQARIVTFSDCINLYPASRDLFALLLLVLPTEAWKGIADPELHSELSRLLSNSALPCELQKEVQHLREELQLISCFCKDKSEENLYEHFRNHSNDFS